MMYLKLHHFDVLWDPLTFERIYHFVNIVVRRKLKMEWRHTLVA